MHQKIEIILANKYIMIIKPNPDYSNRACQIFFYKNPNR